MILLVVVLGLMLCIPFGVQKWKAEQRRLLLSSQLRQSLSGMVHGLRVGVGFQQALAYAAREIPDPLGAHWRRVLQDFQAGRSRDEALDELGKRVAVREMTWFVAAVQITQTSGGSLADVLETLSETLQSREMLRQKVSALTAQGKASGLLLGLLPFIVMGALWLVTPEMAGPMFTTARGQTMLAGVIVSVAIGGVLIQKIVTLPVE